MRGASCRPCRRPGGFVINGIDQCDYSGFSVSGAGDVNGDGVTNVLDLIELLLAFGQACP